MSKWDGCKKRWYQENREQTYARARQRVQQRVAAGLCVWGTCPNQATHGQLCAKHRDCQRISRKGSKYNLTYLEVMALEEIQRCEVCGSSDRLCIDHNHASGKVRGVICHSCNVALGHAGDAPERLRALARYLEDRNE